MKEKGLLKGKHMQEVYDIVCANPQGISAAEIRQLLTSLTIGTIGGTLRRLKNVNLVSAKSPYPGARYIWTPRKVI
ncbi:MAG: hypothetical protein ACI381_03080 [Candidatus Methanomethylophilaceae archaeon]